MAPKKPGDIAIASGVSERGPAGPAAAKPRADNPSAAKPPRPRKTLGRRLIVAVLLLLLSIAAAFLLYHEFKTSELQARYVSDYARLLKYQVHSGRSDAIIFPKHGPQDIRLGYVKLPYMLDKLEDRGMIVSLQSRFSDQLLSFTDIGLYPPYNEKDQAGLEIFDGFRRPIYKMRNPQRIYSDFKEIPSLIVNALVFIENRTLLEPGFPKRNPAVDWGRFAKAIAAHIGEMINLDTPAMGGSTLATQMEKFRHSEEGRTTSAKEKILQMVSATVRAYSQGEETFDYRKRLLCSYINTVPLAAAPGSGEVQGIGDGMFVWYGVDFTRLNSILGSGEGAATVSVEEQAGIFKQVLSLMIGHRRPSYYFFRGRTELDSLTNSYLRLLAGAGIVSKELAESAQQQPLTFRNFDKQSSVAQIARDKASNLIRNRLAPLFNASVYDLDRMDMTVISTLDITLQTKVDEYLTSIRKPDGAEAAGILGKYLLNRDQVDDISYSFTLFEKTSRGNLVRVQTDTTGLPFDINEGSKLELGSTAKIRTLATYLEIIAELHGELSKLTQTEVLKRLEKNPDTLTRWACNWFLRDNEKDLVSILEAALQRPYSASPNERFFTGGGMHQFNNFRREDNDRVVTVFEALENSINLPFIRIMQDIVNNTRAKQWENFREILQNDADPRRKDVLDRFIDRESRVFLSRFWQKYKEKDEEQRLDALLAGLRPTTLRLSVIHRHLYPQAKQADFAAFLRENLPGESLGEKKIASLYEKYRTDAFSLQDKGYLAAVHPLELWLLSYLQGGREKSLEMAMEASSEVRRDVYGWLLRTRAKNSRDSRIRTVLEIEAFSDIHRRWKKLGYPFDHLVPSLATALGSSGDKPAGLAELMGIILSDGKRLPTYRFSRIEFARDTPYETTVEQSVTGPAQVMIPEVAQQLKKVLAAVVTNGTARRLSQTFVLSDERMLAAGGKTGTGDNRIVISQASGQRISSKARNRTATFVFYLGDYHFGTLTAFVTGNASASYSFTSALPLQVLKSMAPRLLPYLEGANPPSD